MNERIKELAVRSGANSMGGYIEQNNGESVYSENAYIDPRDIDLAKFAELIVKECAGIYSKIDNGNQHMGTDDYPEALHKTFFGVEE